MLNQLSSCLPSLLASHPDNQAGILTSTGYGVTTSGHPNLMSPYGGAYSGHYIEGYRGQYPGHYTSGGGGGQVPPTLPRPAPAPLAPRDRSSSAPNVCINLVNPNIPSDAASLAEFAHRMGRNYNPTSPGLCFCHARHACPGNTVEAGQDRRQVVLLLLLLGGVAVLGGWGALGCAVMLYSRLLGVGINVKGEHLWGVCVGGWFC